MATRNELRLRRASASDLFRAVFCAVAGETPPLVLDVRPRAAFSRGHVAGAYCVRASANAAALLDYSGGGQPRPWAQGVWHDATLLLIGDDADAPLDARHPVVAFLIKEGAARAVSAVKGGCVLLWHNQSSRARDSAEPRFLLAIASRQWRRRTPSCAPAATWRRATPPKCCRSSSSLATGQTRKTTARCASCASRTC
jgi:hypothetical protein